MNCTQIYCNNFKKLSNLKPKCELSSSSSSSSSSSTLSLTNATVCTHKSWNSLSMFQLKTLIAPPLIRSSSPSSFLSSSSSSSSYSLKELKTSTSSLVKYWLENQQKIQPKFQPQCSSSFYQKNIYIQDFTDLSFLSSFNTNTTSSSFLTNSTNSTTISMKRQTNTFKSKCSKFPEREREREREKLI
jgi:hypothetical protein